MRAIISGGATGGHIYPALSVVRELVQREEEPVEVLWLGGKGPRERELVSQAGLPYRAIAAGGVRGLAPWEVLGNLLRLAQGLVQAWREMGSFRPEVTFVTGGYSAIPVALAARLRRLPVLVYLPDIEPGVAVQFLARVATRVAASFAESAQYLPQGKVMVTGYPVRAEILAAGRDEARRKLGPDGERKMLLVIGGSQGAHSINRAVSRALPDLLESCQIIHLCGAQDEGWLTAQREELPERLRRRYRLHAYLHEEMAQALAAADLALGRAGASVLGEFPAVGLPSILVPYPYAGGHQRRNAQFLAEKGAALIMKEKELAEGMLAKKVKSLLDDEKRLEEMGRAAKALAQPQAAQRLAQALRDMR